MTKEKLFLSILVKLFTVIFFTIFFTGFLAQCQSFGEEKTQGTDACRFLFDLKTDGTATGALNQPAGIAADDAGNIYIADTVNSRIVVLDDLGKIKFVFGKLGEKPGELSAPMAVAVDTKAQKIYVADSSNRRVQVFKTSGEFLSVFDLNKELGEKEKPVRPIGIAVSSEGNVYLSDADNSYIRVYDPLGKLLFKFGGFGAQDGKFCLPVGLFIDKADKVYAVDMNNARLQIFDKEGEFLAKLGSAGDTKGSFGKPKAVCADDRGFIYVSDAANLVVQVFDKEGKFYDLIGSEKEKELQFASPFGLAVSDSRLYITDRWRNSVRVYEIRRNER